MAGDNRLTLFSVDVDTSTGKASMREFVRESERAGRESEAAFKRGASAGMSESERAAFLKPIDDLHKELLGRIRGLGSATSSMEREAVSASAGVARGFAGIATAAGFAAAGVGLVAFGLDQFADAAEPVTNLSRGFDTLTMRIGESSDVMLGKARAATRGLVSDMELMRLTNQAILLGIPMTSDRMAELAEISTKLGRSMGVDAEHSLEALIDGLGRQSNRLLDNIGIVVDADAAYRDYARSVGKTADSLTDAEKRVAFTNAAIDSGRTKVRGMTDEVITFGEAWHSAGTKITNTKNELLDLLNRAGGAAIAGLSDPRAIGAATGLVPEPGGIDLTEINNKIREITQTGLDPGGRALAQRMEEVAGAIGKTEAKLKDLRSEAGLLRTMMAEPREPEQLNLMKLRLVQINDEVDKLLGKKPEFKGFPMSEMGSRLSIPKNPSAPFGGDDPFGGRVPGLELHPDIQKDPFGDAESTRLAAIADHRADFERSSQDQLLQIRINAAAEWSQQAQNLESLQLENVYALRIQAAQKAGADTSAIFESFQIDQAQLEQRYSDARVKIAQQEHTQRLQMQATIAGGIASVVNAAFGHTKAGAIASAIASTYQGVAMALGTYPWPYSAVVAGIVSAQGLATVAKIRSTNVGSGGGGGGVSGAGAAPGVNYSAAIRVGGNATGTTPTIVGAPTLDAARAGTGAPVNITIHAFDSKSVDQALRDPALRQVIAEAVGLHNARR